MANTTGQKFGGRAKGTPNKNTAEIRETLQKFISTNIESLQSDFDNLEPQQRIKVFIELSKFVLPTLKATELNDISEDKFKPIIFNFGE